MSTMTYNIESKSDFLTGMYLAVNLPNEEVDINALETIQDDCPDFILPFNYKSANGQTEFIYKIGNYSKLQYFYGDIGYAEYIGLWRSLLEPLFECKDWFMNPCSFVLNADYIFYDKNRKSVVYVYIPARNALHGFEAFREMAVEVVKNIRVPDPELENKILRCLLSEFNPGDFFKMLTEHIETNGKKILKITGTGTEPEDCDSNSTPELHILEPETQKKSGIREGFRLLRGRKKKKDEIRRNGFKNTLPPKMPLQILPPPDTTEDNHTQEASIVTGTAGLRCIGNTQLPAHIEVDISQGEVFTIGRHDISTGKKRSSFEFEARTKAVSRRHAAIERTADKYTIVDLSSSAGTYINDKKIPPNTPIPIDTGCRVSFGNLGADYVWETS